MPCPMDPEDCAGGDSGGDSGTGGDAASEATAGALEELRNAVVEATGDIVSALGTMWADIEPVDLGAGDAGNVAAGESVGTQEATQLLGYVQWIGLVVAAVALILLLAQIGVRTRRGEGIAAVGRIGFLLGGVVLIGGAAGIVGFVLENSGPSGGGAVSFLQSALWWYMGAAAVVAVIVAAIRMAWEQRAQPGRDLIRGLITLVVVAGAGVTIIQTLITVSDNFSRWIIGQALDCDSGGVGCFEQRMANLLIIPSANGVGERLTVGPLTVIILGLIAVLVAFCQIILMIARSGMLIVLAGVLPLAASATTTDTGLAWFKRAIGWIAALILYKPAAAIIYAAAFQLAGFRDLYRDDGSGVVTVLSGIMLMTLALAALPALMRFVTPMVAAVTASGGMSHAPVVDAPTGARPTSPSGAAGPTGAPGPAGARAMPGIAGRSGPRGSNASATGGQGSGSALGGARTPASTPDGRTGPGGPAEPAGRAEHPGARPAPVVGPRERTGDADDAGSAR